MKQLALGILAHVDAGKTTLSEAILYASGEIRRQGRVDHGDAFHNGIDRRVIINISGNEHVRAACDRVPEPQTETKNTPPIGKECLSQ